MTAYQKYALNIGNAFPKSDFGLSSILDFTARQDISIFPIIFLAVAGFAVIALGIAQSVEEENERRRSASNSVGFQDISTLKNPQNRETLLLARNYSKTK